MFASFQNADVRGKRIEAPPARPARPAENGTTLPDAVFRRFSDFIESEMGIKMPASKKTMLQSRLQKRLRKLGLSSFEAYHGYVLGNTPNAEEIRHLMDIVTTNKTDFFREPRHFEVLTGEVLPELMARCGAGVKRPLGVWSAGCSTGAEPYTLAMVLSDFAERVKGFRFSILASDISTRVLAKAKTAIYDEREIAPIPMGFKKRYLLRSKDRSRSLVRIVPELRRTVGFFRLNFMDDTYGLKSAMDLVFCRNVIIYFDRETQEKVLRKICRHLRPGGYLFMGHSETLNGFDLMLTQRTPTVYRKVG